MHAGQKPPATACKAHVEPHQQLPEVPLSRASSVRMVSRASSCSTVIPDRSRGVRSSVTAMVCGAWPHPRLRILSDAATRAAAGACLSRITSTKASTASSVYSRASAVSVRPSAVRWIGRPFGLPLFPGSNGIGRTNIGNSATALAPRHLLPLQVQVSPSAKHSLAQTPAPAVPCRLVVLRRWRNDLR